MQLCSAQKQIQGPQNEVTIEVSDPNSNSKGDGNLFASLEEEDASIANNRSMLLEEWQASATSNKGKLV